MSNNETEDAPSTELTLTRGRERFDPSLIATATESMMAKIFDTDYLKTNVEAADELVKGTDDFLTRIETLMAKYHKFTDKEMVIRKDIKSLILATLRYMLFMATYTHGFLGTSENFKKGVKHTFDDLFCLLNATDPTDIEETLNHIHEIIPEILYPLFEGTASFERHSHKDSVQLEHAKLLMFGKVARVPGDEGLFEEEEEESQGIGSKIRTFFRGPKKKKEE